MRLSQPVPAPTHIRRTGQRPDGGVHGAEKILFVEPDAGDRSLDLRNLIPLDVTKETVPLAERDIPTEENVDDRLNEQEIGEAHLEVGRTRLLVTGKVADGTIHRSRHDFTHARLAMVDYFEKIGIQT